MNVRPVRRLTTLRSMASTSGLWSHASTACPRVWVVLSSSSLVGHAVLYSHKRRSRYSDSSSAYLEHSDAVEQCLPAGIRIIVGARLALRVHGQPDLGPEHGRRRLPVVPRESDVAAFTRAVEGYWRFRHSVESAPLSRENVHHGISDRPGLFHVYLSGEFVLALRDRLQDSVRGDADRKDGAVILDPGLVVGECLRAFFGEEFDAGGAVACHG